MNWSKLARVLGIEEDDRGKNQKSGGEKIKLAEVKDKMTSQNRSFTLVYI